MTSSSSTGNFSRILHTPSVFARANLMYLQETGSLTTEHPHTSHRKDLASFLFFMVKKGSGSLTYHQQTYPLKSGDCVFLFCQDAYSHQSNEENWDIQWVHFYGSTLLALYQKYQETHLQPVFHAKNLFFYEQIMQEIYDIADGNSFLQDIVLGDLLNHLVTQLFSEQSSENVVENTTSAPIHKLLPVKTYLEKHFVEKISLDFLAEQFFFNKYYLTRLFKAEYGVTIKQYLIQLRITKAKKLLRFSPLSVSQIAIQSGMPDASYFTHIFLRMEGMTPRDFRKKWQE
jgi:AraC family transcriptional regulator of arabinose operon